MSASEARIDTDFRAQRASVTLISPYMSRAWQKYLGTVGDISSPSGYSLPESVFERAAPSPKDAGGGSAIAHAQIYLERHNITSAVLNPGNAAGIAATSDPELAAELARATNDWLIAEWLDKDQRFRGSIVVGPRDPKLAAAEVRRLAPNARMAQVLLAYPPCLLGDRSLRPIHDAASECGLPIHLQAGGAFAGANRGLTPVGYPTTPLEYQLGNEYSGQPHLLNMVFGEVFDRFPNLRLVFSGFGVAWLPSLLWRMDGHYDRKRFEFSKLQHRPSEYVLQRVRFTTDSIELPAIAAKLVDLLALIDGHKLLLWSSGYPDADAAAQLIDALPADWWPALLRDNARALYGERSLAAN